MSEPETPAKERWPADALVKALRGRTVVDATCDAEGVDDVRLRLDDGTIVLIDTELDEQPQAVALAEQLSRPPWSQLVVKLGGDELWPFDSRSGWRR